MAVADAMRMAVYPTIEYQCTGGHPLQPGQPFCSQCGSPALQVAAPARVPSGVAKRADNVFQALIILGVIALIVAGVLMFGTPHASYDEWSPSSSGGYSQQTQTTSCITGWRNLIGDHPVIPAPAYQYQQTNLNNANTACGAVIAGRQRISFLLLASGIGLVIAAWVRRTRRSD
jgi:hypothetical protein